MNASPNFLTYELNPELLPPAPARVHFTGIGGVGMSGLARLLAARGYRVSGSDAVPSPQTDALSLEGITVTVGAADPALAAAADLLIITAAVREDHPEVAAAGAAGVPRIKRAELLALLTQGQVSLAVAGSHGKSTTSGMLVAALRSLGADPSYAVGATLLETGTNAAAGGGPVMVVEADEYDRSFLWLRPDIAVVTNIDYDHPDVFPDQTSYEAAFAAFVANVRPNGTLIIAGDDPACARLLSDRAVDRTRIVTFGDAPGLDWRVSSMGSDWLVADPHGKELTLSLRVPGLHNARNATAALAALVTLGFAPDAAGAALGAYSGVARRFEIIGRAGGVTVIDDYAHHPNELRATIAAARGHYPTRSIWAVFQPHTYSRTQAMLEGFAGALHGADRIMLLDVYAARETDTLGVSAADLLARLPVGAIGVAGPSQAVERLATELRPGDLVLTLGAGDITTVGPALLQLLTEARAPRQRRPGGRGTPASQTIPECPNLKLLADAPMSAYTTWRIGGPADLLVRAAKPDELSAAYAWGVAQGYPVTVIGGGSNLLVGDGGIRGLVIVARTPGERAEGLTEVEDRGDHVLLRVAAQAPLSWVGRYAAERGWSGMEWGVGLPGQIGGATVNNAGAHDTELIEHLVGIVVLNNNGVLNEHNAGWLEASYRNTRFKATTRPRSDVVLTSIFALPRADPACLTARAEEHARFRKETQPTGACSGSIFANPPGDFAGRLLEAAGLKGFQHGQVQFSA
ncbi:MAG: UDP-N-acetylmuramate--L-alanine ligase, partial [Chloroflexia bacterium]|nr:UDP-N-acetylmuramate--L-alanine ligase [Chloroflexia bacterium]